jgi:hypothetical protein
VQLRPRVNAGHRLPLGGDRCDFCGSASVVKLHHCRNFTWEGQPIFAQDAGRWASCHSCSQLIDVGEWNRLSLRVMREVAKRKGVTEEELKNLRRSLKTLHTGFGLHLLKGEDLAVLGPKYSRFVVRAGGGG